MAFWRKWWTGRPMRSMPLEPYDSPMRVIFSDVLRRRIRDSARSANGRDVLQMPAFDSGPDTQSGYFVNPPAGSG